MHDNIITILTTGKPSHVPINLSLAYRNHFGLKNNSGKVGPIMNIEPKNVVKNIRKTKNNPPMKFRNIFAQRQRQNCKINQIFLVCSKCVFWIVLNF